jgi:hypothetical protein
VLGMNPASAFRFSSAGVIATALLVAACGRHDPPSSTLVPPSGHAEVPQASADVPREPEVIWVRLLAERKAGALSAATFSIVLDAPAIQLHRIVADITSPYACRSTLFGPPDRGFSVRCTPSFKKPVATVVFRAQRIDVHLLGANTGNETLSFDLPPGTVARGEERELIATALEGRTCAGSGPARDVDLRVSARPGLEGATGIYLEGSALRARLKMWDLWGDYGCSFKLDERAPDWSLLDCRLEGQHDYLWLHAEPDSLLLISKVWGWGTAPMQVPTDLAELVTDRNAEVGRISLPCRARVRVREAEFVDPGTARFGQPRSSLR